MQIAAGRQVISLYELIGMKKKNSVLKSVFINRNPQNTMSLCDVDVEAYDDTFINNSMYPSQKKRTFDVINRAILKHQDKIKEFAGIKDDVITVMHYSLFDRHVEHWVYLNEEVQKMNKRVLG